MPSLTPEDREALLGPANFRCPKCKQVKVKNYCRSCDEFFYECACPVEPDAPGTFYKSDHRGCRTY